MIGVIRDTVIRKNITEEPEVENIRVDGTDDLWKDKEEDVEEKGGGEGGGGVGS